jgi:hypothetical protein
VARDIAPLAARHRRAPVAQERGSYFPGRRLICALAITIHTF